jgi:hypothetical protein
VKLAKQSQQQSARRGDGPYALRPLCRLAAHDKAVAQRLADDQLWQIVLAPESFIHAPGFIAKLNEKDLSNLVALFAQRTFAPFLSSPLYRSTADRFIVV